MGLIPASGTAAPHSSGQYEVEGLQQRRLPGSSRFLDRDNGLVFLRAASQSPLLILRFDLKGKGYTTLPAPQGEIFLIEPS